MAERHSTKPIPDIVKMKRGTYKPSKVRKQTVKVTKLPAMPRGLDAKAKQFWKHVCKTRKDWLDESDQESLRVLSELWSRMRTYADASQKDPLNGKLLNDWLKLVREFGTQCKRFGLTPLDREKIGPVTLNDVSSDEVENRFFA